MKIFDKRPLSLILCIMLGSFVVFSLYDTFAFRSVFLSLLLASFILSFIKPISKFINSRMTRIVVICSLISVLFSYVYFDLWFNAYNRFDGDVSVIGTVENIETTSNLATLYIKTDSVDGAPFSKYDLNLLIDYNEYYGYSVGSKIRLTGEIEPINSYVNSFDAYSFYRAKGISGAIYEVKDFEIIENGDFTNSYKLSAYREKLCRKIIYNSNGEVGGLLAALLLGEKSMLPLGTQLHFSRIGISHILALSGMHLAILTLGLKRFLIFLRISKKPATLITIIFTFFYMGLTGFQISVVRAGTMLILSSLLFLLSSTKDSMTSLFVAVSLICIFEPYSIYDISLWLSAFATLGIVVMSEIQTDATVKHPLLKWIYISLMSSIFAISATFIFVILKFDGISLIAPLTTLIFSVLVEIFLYVGVVFLIVGSFLPVKLILLPIGYTIINLAKRFSDIEWIYVATNFKIVEILAIIFTVLFFSYFIFEIKHKNIALSILTSFLCIIFITASLLTHKTHNKSDIVYFNGECENIVITDDDNVCAVHIGSYDRKTGYFAYSNLAQNNLTKIDKYVLTHYSYYVEENILALFNSILVKEIYIPVPQNETEASLLRTVSEIAEKFDVKLCISKNENAINVGEHKVIPLYNSEIGSVRKNLITIYSDDKFYTYLNMDMFEGYTKNLALELINTSRAIIIGRYESSNSEHKFIYKTENPNTIIFSSKSATIHKDTFAFYKDIDFYFNPRKISLKR